MIYLDYNQTNKSLRQTENMKYADFAINDNDVDNLFYIVEFNYTTGNSFNSEDENRYIDILFYNQEDVELAVKLIKTHAKWYSLINDSYCRNRAERQKEIDKCISFLKNNTEEYDEWSFTIKSEINGNKTINAVWNGYFETLNCVDYIIADIRTDEDEL
ncbi:MAG: hypothetical protein PHF21_03310 [Bacilli bacterium]|nr:hypothetical protein [Bacilli bacterium]